MKRRLGLTMLAGLAFSGAAFLTSMQMANQACFLGNHEARWQQFFPFNLLFFCLWGTLLPVIVTTCQKLQKFLYNRRFLLLLHAVSGLLLALVHMGLMFLASSSLGENSLDPISAATTPRGFFSKWIYSEMLSYLALAALVHLVLIYRRHRQQELRASQLSAELAQSRLQALKMQIHPHFLFNTLNSISSYVYKDQQLAVRMISRLSELLRLTLETGEVTELLLDEELAITRKYLEIEQIRFADRLKVEFDLDPSAQERLVPALILQPLVENAIRHGISPLIAGGTITIRTGIRDGMLAIEIDNDGSKPGPPCRENGGGIGLKNVRARLERRYGKDAALTLEALPSGGCRAALVLPSEDKGCGDAS